ncbi:hypothetical protein NC653_032298 [Populus alba x Populus x berolinensis]|uniref:EF-hand domain-containing protein n=1 Tax=Populus alba x Populus x berolinensis TaxID=444605 RepID=A0AAD6PZM9_9ROSI|nr:hypothetical protein NC653_032298 [Populus alba x Populus x berolinensis]
MAIKNRNVTVDGERAMTMGQFRAWMKTIDGDKDGKISKDELSDAVRGNGGWFAGWKARRGVGSADSNGNGFVDESEIVEGGILSSINMRRLHNKTLHSPKATDGERAMTMGQFRAWMKTIDGDKDGKISKDETLRRRPWQRRMVCWLEGQEGGRVS